MTMKLYEKPNVKEFKTPFGYYFYDASRNEIIKVREELFWGIHNAMQNDFWRFEEEKIFDEYLELFDYGYFHKLQIDKLEHPETNNISVYLEKKIDGIILQITQQCNLRCNYCVYSENSYNSQRPHSSKIMSYDMAIKALDFLYDHSYESKDVIIGFYGGEPLLEFDLLKRIVSYGNNKFSGKQITYTITTNGTLLSKEVIDFLSKNNISLTISLDGPEIIHDGNRIFRDSNKGSFRIVKRNIDNMWGHNPAYAKTVSVNMVIDPNNDFSLINSIFDDKNIRKLTFQHSSVEIEDGWIGSSEKYLQEASYHEFLSYMMEMNRVHSKKVAKISRDEMESLKFEIARMEYSPKHKIGAPSGPCVPGKKRLFCNVDGNLFPCERVSEKAECMNIGNIISGFELEKVDALLNISRMNNACKNCWAFSLCKTCAKKVEQNGQLSLNKMLKNCTMAKADAEALIRSKILLDELTTHTAKMWSVMK